MLLAVIGMMALAGCEIYDEGSGGDASVVETFTVTFDTHGGTPVSPMVYVSEIKHSPVTTRRNYDFEGWYDSATYENKITFPYALTSDMTLHANWTSGEVTTTYTVTFETNGGTPVESLVDVTSVEAEPQTERTGYRLLGWFTSNEELSPISYPYILTKDTTLYAKWEADTPTYRVDFDTDGGTPVNPMIDVSVISTAPVTTKSGYALTGWYLSTTDTDPVTFPYEVNENTTLHAKWIDTSVINIDGYAVEYIWSNDVMSKAYHVDYSNNYKTEVYALRNDDGIYLFVRQHVLEKKIHATDWWENDNIEFRFAPADDFFNSLSDYPQVYISKLNGGTISTGQVAATDYHYNSDTGLYDVNYEAFISYSQLGITDNHEIVFAAGSNYYDNHWAAGNAWSYASENIRFMNVVDVNGINTFSYANSYQGTELISSPISETWDGDPAHNWKSSVYNVSMDGSSSWLLKLSMSSTVPASKVTEKDMSAGIVGEIYSPSWSEGGWTFTRDWNGWGGWHDSGEPSYRYNYTDICEHATNEEDFNTRVKPILTTALADYNATALVSYDSTKEELRVNILYTSNVSDYVGKKVAVSYRCATTYTGTMKVSFGYNFASFTITSAIVSFGDLAS